MKLKISNSIISILIILCLAVGFSVSAFAEPEDPFNSPNISIGNEENSEQDDDLVIDDADDTTDAPTKAPTKAPTTTEKQTQKSTEKAENETEERPQQNNNNYYNNQADEEEATKQTSFTVYLERNNGERRLSRKMEKAGIVPAPTVPLREGYTFEGWYQDKELTKPWDFSKDIATKEMTFYAKWVANEDTVVHKITVDANVVGGTIEVNPSSASKGEPIFITVTPDKGKKIVKGSLLINGSPSDVFSFIMPDEDVVISAEFEDKPEVVVDSVNNKTPILYIAILALVVVIIAIVIIFIKRRHDMMAPLEEEDFNLISEDDDDISWVDDSITVTDGFK
ncbi:MAG: InlB B-repeat-containing protein, partial [Oscillospiraceae bacterium]|nr:InlB B-repeat-containing protein [Oscillospiraceae bacterium]